MKKVLFIAVVGVFLCLQASVIDAAGGDTLGDACTDNSNCSAIAHAVCTNSVCACDTGFSVSNGECLTSVNVGGNCSDSVTTVCGVDNSRCVNDLCTCNAGFIVQATNTLCGEVLGMDCSDDATCTDALDHTVCTNSHCACAAGHEASHNQCAEASSADVVKVQPFLAMTLLLLGCHMF